MKNVKRYEMHLISVLLIFFLFAAPDKGYGQHYPEEGWKFRSKVFSIKYDTLPDRTETEIYFRAKPVNSWLHEDKTEWFSLESYVFLPKDSVEIRMNFRNSNVDALKLKLLLYDKNEKLIDSLVYPLDAAGANRMSFNSSQAIWAEMQLYGQSFRRRDTVSLRITEMDIHAKNHVPAEWARSMDTTVIDVNLITPLSMIDELDEFRHKKIVGLGESFYGSSELQSDILEIIRNLLDRNVRLVCFEMPVDMVMNWDLYIQGKLPREYIHCIREDVRITAGDALLFALFMEKIRDVNSSRSENKKIHVAGLDLREDELYPFEYFKAYRDNSKDKTFLARFLPDMQKLDYHKSTGWSVIRRLTEKEQADIYYVKLPKMMESEKKLKKMMNVNDYRFVTDIFSQDIPTAEDSRRDGGQISAMRDSIMWNILRSAISNYASGQDDRTVIYAHGMHLSRTYNPHGVNPLTAMKTLGCYIAERYGDEFWTVGFQASTGYHRAGTLQHVEKSPLQDAVSGSFESAGNETCLTKFYCRANEMGDIYLLRVMSGSPDLHKYQFYPASKGRFDGYVFERNSYVSLPEYSGYSVNQARNTFKYRYLTLLETDMTPYSKTFDLIDCPAAVTVPKGFKLKKTAVQDLTGRFTKGFFESDDRDCLVFINMLLLDDPRQKRLFSPEEKHVCDSYNGDIFQWAKLNLQEIFGLQTGNLVSPTLPAAVTDKTYDEFKKNMEKSTVNFETAADKMIEVRSADYAQKTFNADNALEYTYKSDSYLLTNCKYAQTMCVEKNGRMIILQCLYTEKGYADREKYRKSIESIFKFK